MDLSDTFDIDRRKVSSRFEYLTFPLGVPRVRHTCHSRSTPSRSGPPTLSTTPHEGPEFRVPKLSTDVEEALISTMVLSSRDGFCPGPFSNVRPSFLPDLSSGRRTPYLSPTRRKTELDLHSTSF